MRKYILFLAAMSFSILSLAQDDTTWKEASRESQAYHAYRIKISEPSYNLAKIKAIVKKIKADENEDEKLNQNTYLGLTLREKFTYHMIHPESYSQNCDAMPPIQDEQKKIFAQLPDAFDEWAWSDRQTKFFTANRDSVIAMLKENISKTNRIGVNYKHVIVEINAREMIPFLINTYNKTKKDRDILTVLMLLMKNNEYAPFLTSPSYKKLYADEYSSYKAYITYNKANEDLIIKRATDFYNGVSK